MNEQDVVLTKKQILNIVHNRAEQLIREELDYFDAESNVEEIKEKAIDYIKDNLPDKITLDELNYMKLGNRIYEDYFIIGYSKAEQFIGTNFFNWVSFLDDYGDYEAKKIIKSSEIFVQEIAIAVGRFICSYPYDLLVNEYLLTTRGKTK